MNNKLPPQEPMIKIPEWMRMFSRKKKPEFVKVLLPGERPWVAILEQSGDRMKGRISNILYHELSEHEQARFMKRESGTVEQLPVLHKYKRDDELWFIKGTDNREGWWVPEDDNHE